MSNQNEEFANRIQELAEEYNIDNMLFIGLNEDTSESYTLVSGNDSGILIQLSEQLVESTKHIIDKTDNDNVSETERVKNHIKNILNSTNMEEKEEPDFSSIPDELKAMIIATMIKNIIK